MFYRFIWAQKSDLFPERIIVVMRWDDSFLLPESTPGIHLNAQKHRNMSGVHGGGWRAQPTVTANQEVD